MIFFYIDCKIFILVWRLLEVFEEKCYKYFYINLVKNDLLMINIICVNRLIELSRFDLVELYISIIVL